MIEYRLSKSQKKIAREVIAKGLQKEFADGILKLDEVIADWKDKKLSNRDAWYELYDRVRSHDKHIGRRYDYMTGSNYLFIIAEQLRDGVIDREDLNAFNEEVINEILFWAGRRGRQDDQSLKDG